MKINILHFIDGAKEAMGAVAADEVLTGSFVNAKAVARYIKAHGFEEVSLVCMGNEGIRPAEEDELCAEYIKGLLLGDAPELTTQINALKYTAGKKFFDPARQEVFPERDFYLCTAADKFDFVLKFSCGDSGIGGITKI